MMAGKTFRLSLLIKTECSYLSTRLKSPDQESGQQSLHEHQDVLATTPLFREQAHWVQLGWFDTQTDTENKGKIQIYFHFW